ncbi:MAG: hypothetical protein LBR17_02565 [Bacteroidales bacterium]|nr:hypothetical protein [Bacteroidales bacterium]
MIRITFGVTILPHNSCVKRDGLEIKRDGSSGKRNGLEIKRDELEIKRNESFCFKIRFNLSLCGRLLLTQAMK